MLLLASGRGTRLGGPIPKAFVAVRGVPILVRSARRLHALSPNGEIVLAISPSDRERVADLADLLRECGVRTIVDGGDTRQESMQRALRASEPSLPLVLVHDAARPFFPIEAARTACAKALSIGAALLAVPAPDTLKRVAGDEVVETVARDALWLAQTPQVIRRDVLRTALDHAARIGFVGTDDVSLCEALGQRVAIVPGDRRNLKITTPDDLLLAEAIAAAEDAHA